MATYLDGMDLLEPGLVPVGAWRPGRGRDAEVDLSRPTVLGGVARLL
ncbi:SAM-dependent methyltransferase [Microtetraspora sp. NBRC 16547]|nr:SAM-dependent methyltransferase [Microtetraspora sp. NBRC 16547]